MTNSIEYKVKTFISEYWYYKLDKLKIETTLDDIGMFGDDKYDFIIDFAKKFNLSTEYFPFDRYIDNEIGIIGLGQLLLLLSGKKSEKVYPITISMLINWVEKECWME